MIYFYSLVKVPQSRCGRDVRKHKVERQLMFFCDRIVDDLNDVKNDDGAGDDEGLSNLQAIDAGKDVDCVGAEHCKHPHVHVVKETDVDCSAD